MKEIFDQFKIRLIPESIKRVQMSDEVYFGPDYADYVSNSKLGLLNPAQGGSPQKFLEGFKPKANASFFSLGSSVHQLTLEKNDYVLSSLIKPSNKLGLFYTKLMDNLIKENLLDKFMDGVSMSNPEGFDNLISNIESNKDIEKIVVLAALDADYYTNELSEYKGDDLPSRLKTAMSNLYMYIVSPKPEYDELNRKYIYLPSDQHTKCLSCTNSLKTNVDIQNELNALESYCEDVILCDLEVEFPENFNDPDSKLIKVIVKVKIKIDHWSINRDDKVFTLNDLKTTGKPVQYFKGHHVIKQGFMGTEEEVFVNGSWQMFFYHRQMGMYYWLLSEYIKKEFGEGYKGKANMLVVETIPGFTSKIYKVSGEEILSGFNEFKDLIKRVAYHQHNGYEGILEFVKSSNLPSFF